MTVGGGRWRWAVGGRWRWAVGGEAAAVAVNELSVTIAQRCPC